MRLWSPITATGSFPDFTGFPVRLLYLHILFTVIICVFQIFCKTVLQTVLPIKRFAKSFYKSAIYAGGQYICERLQCLKFRDAFNSWFLKSQQEFDAGQKKSSRGISMQRHKILYPYCEIFSFFIVSTIFIVSTLTVQTRFSRSITCAL